MSHPPLLGIRQIHQRPVTLLTHHASSAPVARRHPTPVLALHDVAGCGKLTIVTPASGTPDLERFGSPYVIVLMLFPHQGMGDLMEEGVPNLLIGSLLSKLVGQGNLLSGIVTTAGTLGGVVKLKAPLRQVMVGQQGSGEGADGS